MYYAIMSRDVEDSLPRRADARKAHIERLRSLVDQGRLFIAGAHPAVDAPDPGPAGLRGSLVIAEFGSLEAARAWADSDPYVESGAYESVEVLPFKPVLP